MFNISLRAFLSMLMFLSVSSAYSQNKVVVVPLGGDDVGQCEAITACEAGQQTLSCPSGNEQISCAIPKRVFVTSTTRSGNLDGLSGADLICQGFANAEGMVGLFKAWLSSGTDSPSTRFVQNDAAYIRLDGEVVASSWSDLTDGSLTNPICVDEAANSSLCGTFFSVWTNTTVGGTVNGADSCGNWLSNGITYGAIGYGDSTTAWTETLDVGVCLGGARLFCFEQ